MQGDSLAARAKVLRTRAAPRPTNISTKSDPEQYNRGTPAVAAVARASIVLPNVDCDGWYLCFHEYDIFEWKFIVEFAEKKNKKVE